MSIIDAVDGLEQVPQADLDQINTGIRAQLWKENNAWVRTKVAIDLSHIRVMHAFLATSADMAVVLEDDVAIEGDLVPPLNAALCNTPNDFDILYLKAIGIHVGDSIGKGVRVFWDGAATHGYVMTRRFAIKMLAEYSRRPPRLWIDLMATAMSKSGETNAYICDPPLIQLQEEIASTVPAQRPKVGFWDNFVIENGK